MEESHISYVSVTDASSRRHARHSRRFLLSTAATVSFTVSVSLAESSFSDASDLENTVSDTLTDLQIDHEVSWRGGQHDDVEQE